MKQYFIVLTLHPLGNMMRYEVTVEFQRDLKKLARKFPSLAEDLLVAQQNAIELKHVFRIDNGAIFAVPGYQHPKIRVFKIKKLACRSLKGRGVKSGIRLIYAHHFLEAKVTYLEMYFKGEKEKENSDRIKQYLQECV